MAYNNMTPTADIGTAPPWMRPLPVGTQPMPLPDYSGKMPGLGSTSNGTNTPTPPPGVQTDPSFDPYAPVSGGNLGMPPTPAAATPPPVTPPINAPTGTNGATYSGTGVISGGLPSWNGSATPGGGVANGYNLDVNTTDLPQISSDYSGDAKRGADAAYQAATQFFDKDFTRDNSALETHLINQGFAPGTEAFTNEMEKQKRGQNAARETAALQAQGVGFDQAGTLLSRALAARAALYGERSDNANRSLAARAQDKGVETAGIGANASMNNAATAASSNQYSTDASTAVALRRLGLDQGNSDINNLISLVNSTRGGVNMPNFGSPAPLDVTGANSIASGNANAAAGRSAANNAIFAQLGGAALGAYLRG